MPPAIHSRDLVREFKKKGKEWVADKEDYGMPTRNTIRPEKEREVYEKIWSDTKAEREKAETYYKNWQRSGSATASAMTVGFTSPRPFAQRSRSWQTPQGRGRCVDPHPTHNPRSQRC